MIQAPSYSDLVAEIKDLKAIIAYLERQLYGAKPDRPDFITFLPPPMIFRNSLIIIMRYMMAQKSDEVRK